MGEMFHQDPIALLDVDEHLWLIRMACAKVVEQDHENQAKQMKQGR